MKCHKSLTDKVPQKIISGVFMPIKSKRSLNGNYKLSVKHY